MAAADQVGTLCGACLHPAVIRGTKGFASSRSFRSHGAPLITSKYHSPLSAPLPSRRSSLSCSPLRVFVAIATPCCRGGGEFCLEPRPRTVLWLRSASSAGAVVAGRMCPAPRHRAPQTPRTTTGAWTSTGTTRLALSSRPTTTRPAGRSVDR